MRIFIKLASNLSSTISPEITWEAFITVAKSSADADWLPLVKLVVVVEVEVMVLVVDDLGSNCGYFASNASTFANAPQRV